LVHKLKVVEKNESAGLYTPRSLIRKPKIYTTIGCKRNYKGSAQGRPGAKSSYRKAKCPFARNPEIPGVSPGMTTTYE